MKIGVIDSGFGGEYISSLLIEKFNCKVVQLPKIYFRSYSDMSMSDLVNQCNLHIEYLTKQNVDIVVIGCMTLSTNLSEYIRSKTNKVVIDLYENLPIFDEETLIISTINTANSGLFNKYIVMPTPDLSSSIENGHEALVPGLLRGYEVCVHTVLPFNKVILGCSHYSGCKYIFENYYKNLEIIDPVNYLMDKLNDCLTNNFNSRDKVSDS